MLSKPTYAESDHSDDSELALRAAGGDRDAQELLFRRLRPSVHATLYRVLGSSAQLEDLLQEVLLEVFRSLVSYRAEAKLATWADRIAVRIAFHHIRRWASTRENESHAHLPLYVVGSPEGEVHHRQGLERLDAVLRDMKPEYRIAFTLFDLDGRSTEEIADLVGITPMAAKCRVSRARRKLWAAARKDDVLAVYLPEQVEAKPA